MKTASAGTVESMDCLVTVSEGTLGSGLAIQLSGAATARFAPTMRKAVEGVARAMNVTDLLISIQDNGALDLILKARTEAALARYQGGDAA